MNIRLLSKKLTLLIATFASLLMCHTASAQTVSLLDDLNMTFNDLDSAQKSNYEKLNANPDITDIRFASINALSAVEDSGRVIIDLPYLDCPGLVFNAREVSYTDDDTYNWYGEILFKEDSARTDTCFNGSLWLSKDARYLLNGMLIVGGSAYQVFDLGGGILAIGIIGVQQEDVQVCGTKGDGGMRITGDPEGCSDKKLKVLVLYTQAATSYVNNLNSFASLCIAQANGILHNSQVYKNVELAGVAVLSGFIENTQETMEFNAIALSNNATAQSLRSQYKADAVIMLVDTVFGSTNGVVKTVAPAFADCYGLVAVTKALPIGFVFTHELSHLLGARHFIDNHSNSYDHAYNFSKHFLGIIPTMTYRTAVHGFTTEHVIPYLSNPTVTYNGKATGTANKNNNSRKVNENFYTVANFYTEAATLINTIDINMYVLPPPPPPFELLCDKGATAIAGATCGTPPFTHDWYESMNGLSYGYAGTGATWNVSQSPGTTFIKLVTTDADNHTATTYG